MATMKNSVTVAGRNLLQTMAPRNAPPTEKPIKVRLWLIRIAAHMAPMVETTSVMSERYVLSSEECPEKTEERVVSGSMHKMLSIQPLQTPMQHFAYARVIVMELNHRAVRGHMLANVSCFEAVESPERARAWASTWRRCLSSAAW